MSVAGAYTQGYQLSLSWSTIRGTATFVDPDGRHRHVLRLRVHRTPFDTFVRWITSYLPSPIRASIRALLPGPFLPPTIIVKQLTPTWDAEFDAEQRIYQKLAPIQSRVIPTFYGEGRVCNNDGTGTRALLLSDVGDTSLHSAAAGALSKTALKARLKPAVRALLELGVEPADQNPCNYHLVEDRVMLLDFEDAGEVDPAEVDELAEAVADGAAHWTTFYHQHNSGDNWVMTSTAGPVGYSLTLNRVLMTNK